MTRTRGRRVPADHSHGGSLFSVPSMSPAFVEEPYKGVVVGGDISKACIGLNVSCSKQDNGHATVEMFVYIVSPQQDDLKLSGAPSGKGVKVLLVHIRKPDNFITFLSLCHNSKDLENTRGVTVFKEVRNSA
ncbi:hypothetical protein PoB_003273400 [Plakobranchus ocellatus]|uniref:Uncharacterized protein n=1 Tax=Plakobranchus ocellatus TaxID=259542 RepID=A0AAV4AEZ5_9GAST|nr:hypothetical protein PoB_003273400 [Plakobranchus ocellatus]